jgi:hypothetical protein
MVALKLSEVTKSKFIQTEELKGISQVLPQGIKSRPKAKEKGARMQSIDSNAPKHTPSLTTGENGLRLQANQVMKVEDLDEKKQALIQRQLIVTIKKSFK